ncbi:unnamed protein product [Rhizoctonia solani]|uniref:Protein CPL1-like domain-containing protein n=1 Tax=Rhizoctonia solani TaxID=456999 RepID=A0A8H3HMA9_9AGAM|nr:unnamed protein product [Rhizoctonia solani]
MLRITSVALASLALTCIVPMGVAGKSNKTKNSHIISIPVPHSDSAPGPSLWRRACQTGQYAVGDGERRACPLGTYNDLTTSLVCKAIRCGYQADGGNSDGTAATGQIPCGVGFYSDAGSATCTPCPVGMYCNARTTCTPNLCDPGTYADITGSGQRCKDCPAGTFNNSYGNTSCCKCCAGWFSQGSSKPLTPLSLEFGIDQRNAIENHTNCERCPNIQINQNDLITGPEGSDSVLKCTVYMPFSNLPRPAPTCSQPLTQMPGTCPPVTGDTPSGAYKRSIMKTCPYGTTRCEVKSGRGGFECVDTLNSLETCGGCDNDCSVLEGTNQVQCLKGHCVIKSCSSGYNLIPRGDGISRGGLDVGSTCIAKKRKSRSTHAFGL